MITDIRQAFLADIIAHPDDDAPRLIFADWLEDGGEPERASVIRYGVANPQRRFSCEGDGDVGLFCGDDYGHCQSCHELIAAGFPPAMTGEGRYEVRRGFVSSVSCTLRQWFDHGRAICESHPIERVEVVDKQPALNSGLFCWWAYEMGTITPQTDDIGIDVWSLLGGDMSVIITESPPSVPPRVFGWKAYATEAVAVDALSAALIRWARTQPVADR